MLSMNCLSPILAKDIPRSISLTGIVKICWLRVKFTLDRSASIAPALGGGMKSSTIHGSICSSIGLLDRYVAEGNTYVTYLARRNRPRRFPEANTKMSSPLSCVIWMRSRTSRSNWLISSGLLILLLYHSSTDKGCTLASRTGRSLLFDRRCSYWPERVG